MARQKPLVESVKRNEPAWAAEEAEAGAKGNEATPEEVSDSPTESESDGEYEGRRVDDIIEEAKRSRKVDLDKAIKLCEAALRLSLRQCGGDQLKPELAPHWLLYGDTLYTREENSKQLFAPPSDSLAKDGNPPEDDKETAWQCLDLARFGFESLLAKFHSQGDIETLEEGSIWDLVKDCMNSGSVWTPVSRPAHIQNVIEDAIFTRLRLGDCSQAETQFEKAIEDFAESLRLCIVYRVPIERALEPSIPLCHCLMALDSERTEDLFQFAILALETELKAPNLNDERIQTLQSTKEDVELQLREYAESHEEVKREAREAIMAFMTGNAPKSPSNEGFAKEQDRLPDADSPVVDLGVIGGRKRKKPDPEH